MNVERTILWDVNTVCSQRCRYCFHVLRNDERYRGIDLDGIRSLLSCFAGEGVRQVCLVGGEPFLRPDLGCIADQCRSRDMSVSVVTNGVPQDRYRDAELCRRFDQADVSFDSFDAGYVAAIGKSVSPDTVIESIRILSASIPDTGVMMTVTRGNLHEIGAVADLCRQLGLPRLKLQPVFVPEGHPLNRELALRPEEILQLVTFYRGNYRLVAGLGRFLTLLEQQSRGRQPARRCNAFRNFAYVDARGRIYRCPTLSEELAGPIFEQTARMCDRASLDCLACFHLIEGANYELEL